MAKTTRKTRSASEPTLPKKPSELEFDFIKGNFFRVIAVDGVFGGVSPQGRSIHMGLFSERQPFPTKTVHPLDQSGKLAEEIMAKRQSRKALVRELEVDVAMDLATALNVQIWLKTKIHELAGVLNVQIDFETGAVTPKIAQIATKSNGR